MGGEAVGRVGQTSVRTAGIRAHEFFVGLLPVAGYLAGWDLPVWVALALSLIALVSDGFIVIARLYDRLRKHAGSGHEVPFYLHRFEEMVRAALLGGGGALLVAEKPIGWLPILAAASIAILEGTTDFSITTVLYAGLRSLGMRSEAPAAAPSAGGWNARCQVCRMLACAPYSRCRWCHMSNVRGCCGLQTSLLMILLLVVAFLLNVHLAPLVVKLLVTMSILTVVALGLAINRQTDELVGALDEVAREEAREVKRCDFLRRLALTESLEAAARVTIEHVNEVTGARRISVMVAEDGVLRIVESLGIPKNVAETVAVPVTERICGRVFETRRAVVYRDVTSESGGQSLGLKGSGASASLPLLSHPLGAGGENLGCINVTDKPGGEFSAADMAELEFVAEVAAISLKGHKTRRELEQTNYDTIRALQMTVEAKDAYVHGHSMRVQAWAVAIGREIGLNGARLQMLSCAAELHDIGKLAVPDSVLNAPRQLTGSEWMLVRQHPFRGAQMIEHIGFLKGALPAILYHHERLDGKGYPEGLHEAQIPLEAKILAVVDSYDAMTSDRPYREPATHEAAAAELRKCIGTQFDGRCVEAFLKILGEDGPALAVSHASAAARRN
jgi:HD-GYP domain-containing protein (c-di-GMP phosphodiesterase class II)